MKKLLTIIMSLTLFTTLLITNCSHLHDEQCGYDTITKTNCAHIHDAYCEGIDPQYGYDPDDPQA